MQLTIYTVYKDQNFIVVLFYFRILMLWFIGAPWFKASNVRRIQRYWHHPKVLNVHFAIMLVLYFTVRVILQFSFDILEDMAQVQESNKVFSDSLCHGCSFIQMERFNAYELSMLILNLCVHILKCRKAEVDLKWQKEEKERLLQRSLTVYLERRTVSQKRTAKLVKLEQQCVICLDFYT